MLVCKVVQNFLKLFTGRKKYMTYNHVHFIGIGGISMSGLAQILLHNNIKVSGSDVSSSNLTEYLEENGAKITIGQSEKNIENPDLVVYTAAISEDNPELMEARRKGIRTIERSVFVGEIMKEYKVSVAVSGTHGKTTTTSMLSHVFLSADTDPTIMVGGELNAIGGNLRCGKNDYMILEACEYHRSFLEFFPTVGIILNVEADHLDYFKDIDDIIEAFSDFGALLPKDGALIVNSENENTIKASKKATCRVITVGYKDSDYNAENIFFDENDKATFDIVSNGEKIATIKLNVSGKHNVLNSLAAFAAGDFLCLDRKSIISGIEAYHGVKRRFELKGMVNGFKVIDDYAHHPTEIRATLTTAKDMEHNKVWCIFQPHTYTRTKTLFDDFKEVLTLADHTIIADIYAAREKDTGLVSSKELAEATEGAIYLESFDKIREYILENATEGDIVITMGAGNIYKVGESLLNKR